MSASSDVPLTVRSTHRAPTEHDADEVVRLELSGRRLVVEHREREVARVEVFSGDATVSLEDGRRARVRGRPPRCTLEVDGERWPRVESETAPLRLLPATITFLNGLAAAGASVWRGDAAGLVAAAVMGAATALILSKRFASVGWALGVLGSALVTLGLMRVGAAAVVWIAVAMNTFYLAIWHRTLDDLSRMARRRG